MDDDLLDQRTSYFDLYVDDLGESEIMLTAVQAIDAGRAQVATLEIKLAEMRDLWMRAEAETASVKTRAKQDIDAAHARDGGACPDIHMDPQRTAVAACPGGVGQTRDNECPRSARVIPPTDASSASVKATP